MRTPEEVFDYPYYDESGNNYESSIPFRLPALVVIILGVGVARVVIRHKRQKRTQEILDTPIDELADSILKKYDEEERNE